MKPSELKGVPLISGIERVEGCVYMDGYDDCLIGHCQRIGQEMFAVYSVQKLIKKHIDDGMTGEEAMEWIDFNQMGAYVGEATPGFMIDQE